MTKYNVPIQNIVVPPPDAPGGDEASGAIDAVITQDGSGSALAVRLPDEVPTLGEDYLIELVRSHAEGGVYVKNLFTMVGVGPSRLLPGPREIVAMSDLSPTALQAALEGCHFRIFAS